MKNTLINISIHILLVFMLASCTQEDKSNYSNNEKITGLSLSSNQVTTSDTLVLTFPQKHPARLAIKDPKDRYFILHDEALNTPLMSHKQYMQTTTLSIKVSKITGVTWINGKRTNKQVFSVPGEYMIYMADNLETEPENTFYLMKSIIYK